MTTGQTVNTFVALLRGVNVSGKNKLFMGDLQACLQKLGFTEVKTYLQSGNVIFKSAHSDVEKLAEKIRSVIAHDFRLEVPVLILSSKELDVVANTNPMLQKFDGDEKQYHCTFLFKPITTISFKSLTLPFVPGELVNLVDRVIYLYCPHGYGKSKLNNSYFERALSVTATTRNWRTVLALQALCNA